MRHFALAALVPLLLLVSACSDDKHHSGDAASGPAAPTGLVVTSVGGGGHLVWMDNSDNEDHFMIMRKVTGGDFDDVGMVPFNTTQYHDSGVTAGMTYVYKVVAMNAKGEASTNEVTFSP